MALLEKLVPISAKSSVLDVGGTPFNWSFLNEKPQITFLNIHSPDTVYQAPDTVYQALQWVVGDGRYLPFPENSFDVCFSNSVIEHVGTFEDQVRFAREISRAGRRYFVQTPDPRFPVEPHFLFPFIHWLPVRFRKVFGRYTTWGLLTRPSKKKVEEFVEGTRLISDKEFRIMFPDAKIISERFCGIPKSLIAVRCTDNIPEHYYTEMAKNY